jgi:hypothetical protein
MIFSCVTGLDVLAVLQQAIDVIERLIPTIK